MKENNEKDKIKIFIKAHQKEYEINIIKLNE